MISVPFGFKREYDQLGQIVYRPYAQVEIKTMSGEWIPFTALVDSGADYILLPKSVCREAGYQWEQGTKIKLTGITRRIDCILEARVLIANVRIGGIELEAPVAFAGVEDVPSLLGREGVFSKFDVLFKQRSRLGEFLI